MGSCTGLLLSCKVPQRKYLWGKDGLERRSSPHLSTGLSLHNTSYTYIVCPLVLAWWHSCGGFPIPSGRMAAPSARDGSVSSDTRWVFRRQSSRRASASSKRSPSHLGIRPAKTGSHGSPFGSLDRYGGAATTSRLPPYWDRGKRDSPISPWQQSLGALPGAPEPRRRVRHCRFASPALPTPRAPWLRFRPPSGRDRSWPAAARARSAPS